MSVIDPDLIQHYYSQLSNQELIDLTQNEGLKLTDEAIDYLFDEFGRRELDNTVLQQMVEKKAQIIADSHMDTANWSYALEARRSGKTNDEILRELAARQISDKEAALILKRIPQFHYENESFTNMIAKSTSDSSLGSVFGVIALFGGSVYLVYKALASGMFLFAPVGIGMVVWGIYILRKHEKEYKGDDYWTNMLRSNPENIVWIKPIVTKHTVALFFTLYRDHKYALSTKDGDYAVLSVETDIERGIFFEGVQNLLPHAHIGFTYEIEALYERDPKNFIATLQEWNLYTPIDTFDLSADISEMEKRAEVRRPRHRHNHWD